MASFAPGLALSWLLGLGVLTLALVRAPWHRLAANDAAHVWCGGVFALVLLWSVKAPIAGAAGVHLLGVTAFTLVVGPPLAVVGTVLALVIGCALHDGAWLDLGPIYVMTALAPVTVTVSVAYVARRWLPRGFFMHVFVEGWLGGALSLCACAALGLASGALAGPALQDGAGAAALVACLASSEAMLTGMLLTVLLLHRPEWIATAERRF